MPWVLNMPKFWIWRSSDYGRVLNMRTLYSVLNLLEYALTELNILELHRVLNMPQYSWIRLNRMWICGNMSEFLAIDRVMNMYHTIHSARSFYKLISTYWEIWRIHNPVKDLKKQLYFLTTFTKNSILNLWEGSEYVSHFKYAWVLNIHKISLISQGPEYASSCNNGSVLNIPGFQICQVSAYTSVAQGSEYLLWN